MLRRFRGVRAGSRNPEAKRGICPVQKETAPCYSHGAVIYVGDDLLSHTLTRAVQSAQQGLTSVFGMGTGVSPAVRSPASLTYGLLLAIRFQAWVARRTWLRRACKEPSAVAGAKAPSLGGSDTRR